KVQVLVQLYQQRRELERLNRHLAATNTELARAHEQLKADNTRELQKLNRGLEQANSELAQANAQLTAEIAERKRAQTRLAEAGRRKDEFLAILAHELRNPLSAMHNGLQLMRMPSGSARQLDWVRALRERQLRHLTRLIDDLLGVSRITTGRIALRREPVGLARIVEQAVEMARPAIEDKRHALAVDLPADPVYVRGDVVRLTQALSNLLVNAAKYMDDGGRIELAVERDPGDEDTAVIRVRDHGQGIEPDMLERVFELFAQSDGFPGRTQSGLGIGLALVRGLVELHGGSVHAASDGPGRGSEFIVRLPQSDGPPPAAAAPTSIAAPAAAPAGARVLIIDDNTDSAQGLAMCLETSGYRVDQARDGAQGLKVALEACPDIVLLDIGLPDIDGYEVAQRLRAQPSLRDVPLIAMTGYGGEADRRRAEQVGIDCYLVKPIDYDVLTGVLNERLAAARSAEALAAPAASEDPSRVAGS